MVTPIRIIFGICRIYFYVDPLHGISYRQRNIINVLTTLRGNFRERKISRFRDFFHNSRNWKTLQVSIREILYSRNPLNSSIREIKLSRNRVDGECFIDGVILFFRSAKKKAFAKFNYREIEKKY